MEKPQPQLKGISAGCGSHLIEHAFDTELRVTWTDASRKTDVDASLGASVLTQKVWNIVIDIDPLHDWEIEPTRLFEGIWSVARQNRWRDDVVTPSRDLAILGEANLNVLGFERAVLSVSYIVLARPNDFHRPSRDGLGQQNSVKCEIRLVFPTDPATKHRGVNFNMSHVDSGRARGNRLNSRLGLEWSPYVNAVA